MLVKAKNNILICLSLGLLAVICITGCSRQPLKTGIAFLIKPSQTDSQVMTDIQSTIENRLHTNGISNPVVQILGGDEILIEIPSVMDINQLISIIGQQASVALSQAQISTSTGNPMAIKKGSALVYEADLTKKDPSQTDAQVMAAVQSKIENRLHAYGISNPVVQIWGNNQIFVEIPPVNNANQAISLIGQVALLEFKEQQRDASGNVVNDADGKPVWIPSTATGSDGTTVEALTGKYLKSNAAVTLDSLGKSEVSFEWNAEGAKLFGQITQRLIGKRLGIFLDGVEIAEPTVQAVITDKGVINNIQIDEAKILVNQLNSGSLDVPLKITMQNDFQS